MQVVTECDDANQAIAAARDGAPDVVVIGMQAVPIGAVRASAGIREVAPGAHVLVVLGEGDLADAVRAVRAGATGFLWRDDAVERAARAVRDAVAGRPVLPAAVAGQLLGEYLALARVATEAGKLTAPGLSDRERACLEGLAQGSTTEQVAAALGLAGPTVENLTHNTVRKLHRYARSEAVMYTVADRIYSF